MCLISSSFRRSSLFPRGRVFSGIEHALVSKLRHVVSRVPSLRLGTMEDETEENHWKFVEKTPTHSPRCACIKTTLQRPTQCFADKSKTSVRHHKPETYSFFCISSVSLKNVTHFYLLFFGQKHTVASHHQAKKHGRVNNLDPVLRTGCVVKEADQDFFALCT